VLGEVIIQALLSPLGPHDMSFIEVKFDDALLVLLVSLNMMPPEPLFHERLD